MHAGVISIYGRTDQDPNVFWACPGITRLQILDSIEELAASLRETGRPDAVVVRIQEPEELGANALAEIHSLGMGTPVIAWVPDVTPTIAFNLAYLGVDALVADSDPVEARSKALERAVARRKYSRSNSRSPERGEESWRADLVGSGCSMKVVSQLIRLVSSRKCTVLITGETGTGKEVVARAIHAASPRASQQMVAINCNAIPGELLEAELFGHVKGAFTGAMSSRIGRFEQANRGTLFLDEIGDLPFPLQAKLLRVLQEREFQRIGSAETVRVDVRIIAATNANLLELVEQGKFRRDLYYRLNVAPVHLPPLRARTEDIPALARHFVAKICGNEQLPPKMITPEIISWLQSFSWPGNVRQLENTIESAVAMSGNGAVLRFSDFSSMLYATSGQPSMFALPSEGINYNNLVDSFERALLSEGLRLGGGNKKRAASLLQLKRTTFSAKLEALGVEVNEDNQDDDEVQRPAARRSDCEMAAAG